MWWLGGVALGAGVLGPGLGPGALGNLDLMVTPHLPVPPGVFGLGPGLSQRVPLFVLLAAPAALVGGPVTIKAFVVLALAAGFVGAGRLVRGMGRPSDRVLVGLLWAGGPFAALRVEVGHLGLLWVIAVLPWVVPRLARPSSSGRASFLAVLALALGGPASGTLALVAVVVALLAEGRDRRPIVALTAAAAASTVWVLPTLSLLWSGAQVAGADRFTTRLGGVWGAAALPGGAGFWLPTASPLTRGPAGAALGLAIAGLAVVGRGWVGRGMRWIAVAGLVLGVGGAVPVVGRWYVAVAATPFGAPLREAQRFLALWLVWACPAAVVGARRLADAAGRRHAVGAGARAAAELGAGLALVGVLGWGWGAAHSALQPFDYPAGWARARALVHRDPGTVVVLPWSEYPPLRFAGGRQVFDPVADYLGGDVLSSYDPAFDPLHPGQEQVDRRSRTVDRIARDLDRGRPPGRHLAMLGVRWVFVRGWRGDPGDRTLVGDPWLSAVCADADGALFAVRGARSVPVRRPVPPLVLTDAPPGVVLGVPAAPGWVRGWFHPVPSSTDGRMVVPAGGGPIWFWPAAVLVVSDLSVLVAVARVLRRRHFQQAGQKTS